MTPSSGKTRPSNQARLIQTLLHSEDLKVSLTVRATQERIKDGRIDTTSSPTSQKDTKDPTQSAHYRLWGPGFLDVIPFLQIFSHKVCTGVLAANNKPIHKRSVEQYLRSVGQIFAAVEGPDPRLNSMGAIEFCLG